MQRETVCCNHCRGVLMLQSLTMLETGTSFFSCYQLLLAQVEESAADKQHQTSKSDSHHAAIEAANVTQPSLLRVVCKLTSH